MTELDCEVADYKRRVDAGETISQADAIWLVNELIYEREQNTRELASSPSDLPPRQKMTNEEDLARGPRQSGIAGRLTASKRWR